MNYATSQIRNIIDGVYDVQKLRIATGNRVVAALRPDAVVKTTEDGEEKQDDSVIRAIVNEYRRVADAYASEFHGKGSIEKALNGTEYIKNKMDWALVENYMRLVETEDGLTKVVDRIVKDHPMWDKFFADVKGCGTLMAGVCLAYLDPYKARHVSSFWKYCGLDVVMTEDGKWEGRQKKHTEMRPYIDKDGNEGEKRSITYRPMLKTKLVGVLGSSFLRAKGSHYGQVYYDYKHRLDQREDLTPIHKHRMATRYAVKMFLRDMWVAWRELEGLEVTEPYEVAKLGHRPHGAA